MPETSSVNVSFRGRMVTFKKNDWVKLTLKGEHVNLGRRGDRAQLVRIMTADRPESIRFDLLKEKAHSNWGDLGGVVSHGKGLSIYYNDLKSWFAPANEMLQVKEDFVFKKKNLKGMECKVIASFRNNEVFVEMAEHIGGGSCDGLGRKGHCVIIKEGMLARKATPNPKKKTTSKGRRKR